MVDYCFQQNILFGNNCDTDSFNLLSDQESSCASTDLNNLLLLDFDTPTSAEEEMINNGIFSSNQNSNNSTCSNSNQTSIYNTSYSTPLLNGFNQLHQPALVQTHPNQINQQQRSSPPTFNQALNGNIIQNQTLNQDPQFNLMSNSNFNVQNQQQTNSANPLLSYSNHQIQPQNATNDLIRLPNDCAMSPSSNASTVSSTHTLPSFLDTYSSTKCSTTAADLNNTLIEDKTVTTLTNSLATAQQLTQPRSQVNLDENQFDSELFYDDFESPLNQQNNFDDQSYSNSSFTSVNLPTPPTTTADLVTMNNCQPNQLFNLSSSNCSSSLLINTPVSTPLNGGILSNCSSPISSIQESFKPIKFKQEPANFEYDCNNNLTTMVNQNQPNNLMNNLVKPNQPTTSIYSPGQSFNSTNKMNNLNSNNMLYNNSEFNNFELDLYGKNEILPADEMNNQINLQDSSRIGLQTNQTFNTGANTNRISNQFNSNSGSNFNKCTTLTNKKASPLLFNQQQNRSYYSQNNRLKLFKNQTINDSSAFKAKQMNQFSHLNSAKFGSNTGKSSLICLVCGDQASCCHYKVITCEGCKGFFKRTVQKAAKYTCLGNKDCVVDKRRRNRCQYCRFQKCLQVGMVREVVRTDSLKGRRGRLPSKAKFPINISNNSLSIEFIRPLLEKLISTHPVLKKPKQSLYRNENDCLELSPNNSMEYNNQSNLSASFNGQFPKMNEKQYLNQFKEIALQFTFDLAREIPGFNELDESDRKSLILNSSLEVFTLFFAYRHSPGMSVYEFDENFLLSRQECDKLFGQWFRGVEELMGRLQNMQIDLLSFTYLLAIVILYGYSDLNNCDRVDKIQNKLVNSLKEFTDKDIEAQKKPSFFPKLLNLLPDLKNLKSFMDDSQFNSNLLLQFY